jgi:hypothetical protein
VTISSKYAVHDATHLYPHVKRNQGVNKIDRTTEESPKQKVGLSDPCLSASASTSQYRLSFPNAFSYHQSSAQTLDLSTKQTIFRKSTNRRQRIDELHNRLPHLISHISAFREKEKKNLNSTYPTNIQIVKITQVGIIHLCYFAFTSTRIRWISYLLQNCLVRVQYA